MNKSDFLAALDEALRQLPPENRRATLDYYSEMIDDRIEDGLSEADAVAAMGNVHEIARQVLEDTPLTTLVKTSIPRRSAGFPLWLTILLLVIGSPVWLPLGLAFAVVVLSIYICIWAVILSCWVCDLAFLLAGPASIVALLWFAPGAAASLLFTIGAALVVCGLGFLLLYPCLLLSRALVQLTATVGRGIKRLFIRKERK